MPYKDPEKAKQRRRERYLENREHVLAKTREYREKNREKCRALCRRWHKENPVRAKALQWKHRGLPQPTRDPPANCECCGGSPGKKALHLDHDHTTGKFRGWLCSSCNTGLGLLGDTAVALRRALRYLRK